MLRRARGDEAVAGGVAQREPARPAAGIVASDAGRGERERERQRVGGGAGVELEESRGYRGDGEGRGEIARPDAAIERRGSVDGAAEPGHRLVAGENRGDDVVGARCRHHRRQRKRAGNDDRAGRGHRGEIDVVDLAQPGKGSAGGEIERQCVGGTFLPHRRAEVLQQRAFQCLRARDPGADGVDDVQLDQFAHVGGDRRAAAGDMAAESFERGHEVSLGLMLRSIAAQAGNCHAASSIALRCVSKHGAAPILRDASP